jgi:hypothetical protein
VGGLQFRTVHLLGLMVATAVLLAGGRAFLTLNPGGMGQYLVWPYISAASVLLLAPILVASLARRYALLGILLAAIFGVGVTVLESSAWEEIGGVGPSTTDFFAFNGAAAVIALLLGLTVRLRGYCLDRAG